jgi:acyl-CoA synthetase (AMP-forming)/AMP-acid ligase II
VGELRLPELGDRYNAAETYVDAHRAERPDKVAIRCQGTSVTYGEMAANVDRCGNALRQLGVDIEDRVVILCLDSPAFVYTFFGAIKLGAIPVPTNTLLVARDLAYILRDSRAVAIVVSAPLLPKVLEVRKQCPRLRHILVTTSGGPPPRRSR